MLSATFYFISAIASPFVSRIGDKNGKPLQMIGLGLLSWFISLLILAIGILERNMILISIGIGLGGFASCFYHPMDGATIILKAV